tara:strand:+ start:3495 stop:4334 length:840 start_codon:yes stop_codon:yes gene_type:complete
MSYLEGERGKIRESLKNYFPEFQSAISFLFSYKSEKLTLDQITKKQKVAGYAFGFEGRDYHYFVLEALNKISDLFFSDIKDKKTVVDTSPVLDRDLAYRAGLGWFGKNSMLISRNHGSYVMIGSILLGEKLELPIKEKESDHCGTCTRCIDACPTFAIDPETRTVNSEKCIPYFTIELFKDSELPPKGYDQMDEFFGCDICQEVCPWNRPLEHDLTKTTELTDYQKKISDFFLNKTISEIQNELKSMSKRKYSREWKDSSFCRTGRDGVLKNLKWKKKN